MVSARKFAFRMGDAFPANDVVARWVSGLSRILNQLITVNKQLYDIWHDRPESKGEAIYFFGLVLGHYREATNFDRKYSVVLEVQNFIESLPLAAKEDYRLFRESFDPWEGSLVQSILKDVRNDVFHPGSDEDIQEALRETADLQSSITVGSVVAELRMDFADEVNTQMVFRHLGNVEEQLRSSIQVIGGPVFALIRFAQRAADTYLAQLPDGVVTHSD